MPLYLKAGRGNGPSIVRFGLGARWLSAFSHRSQEPHAVLGVPYGASPDEVRQAYLQRAKQLHPDQNPSSDAQKQFQQLQSAYTALRNGSGAGFRSAGSSAGPGAGAAAAGTQNSGGWEFDNNPMGSGMHYDEWRQFHAQRARPSETAWQRTEQPGSTWSVLLSRRAWVRYGLVHRALYRSFVLILALWPLWLIVGLTSTLVSRRHRAFQVPAHAIHHDGFGRAWWIDVHGIERRCPEYDNMR